MKKAIYLFLVLLLAACGNSKTASLTQNASVEPAAAKVTVESVVADMDKGKYAQGELLVKFKSGVVRTMAAKTHQALGAAVIKRFSAIPTLEHVRLPAGLSVKDAVIKYMGDANVEYAEPNYVRRASITPNDQFFGQQWALQNNGAFASGTVGADIKATPAWDIATGRGDIIIAVLDTGIDLGHPDLLYNIDPRGKNFVTGAADATPLDDDGHGTHVSGIIGAIGQNGIGTAGVMWSVKILPLKFIGVHPVGDCGGTDTFCGTVADEVDAIDYLLSLKSQGANIRVVNASYGGGGGFPTPEFEAFSLLNNAGILAVVAAGNEGANNDLVPAYPANFALPNIISVAATDQNDMRTSFSNFGQNVHVAAPGNYILSTVPIYLFPNGYDFLSGTSMSAPHVSGLAGLLSTYYTTFTMSQVRGTILRYVDLLPTLVGWIQTGGRINAYNAVSSLLTPTGFTATADTSSQVSLAWTGNASGEDGYQIRRSTGSGPSALIATVARISRPGSIPMPPTPYSFTDNNAGAGLTDGTQYTYEIKAFNSLPNPPSATHVEGDSFPASVSAVTPLNPPTGLTATAVSTSQVNLKWVDNSQTEGGYKIERQSPGADFVQIGTTGPNVTAFSDTALASNTTYTYRVMAFNNAAGNSTYSNAAVATTLPAAGQSTSSGGGGGCSIGAKQNAPTAVADFAVLLMPLLFIMIVRHRR